MTNQTGSAQSLMSLYLHIPFCDHKCSYCDFNSYAGLDRLMPAFTEALVRELRLWAPRLRGRRVPTVFFGGGTPSLTPLPDLARITQTIRAEYRLDPEAEISLEANPGTVDLAYLRGLREIGINRLSIGVQSLDDGELRMLDRIHDAGTAIEAYEAARAAGFDNVNLDLIFGVAGQTLAGWERTLRRAIALAPEHLSLYALTIEEGTALAAQIARGIAPEPDADLQAAMYERTQDLMAAAGYEHYEISNWCRPGFACRHNLVYWQDGEWLGLGPGAHSHLDGRRFAVVRSPGAYIDRVAQANGRGSRAVERTPQIDWEETPDEATARADAAILALRLSR
ncbi:MAG: radical SAM family heme chaperone HemW, partial [Dehalococcoidia bacterium]